LTSSTGRGLRVLGHPAHPILTAFPIALWSSSFLWDLTAILRPELVWSQLAFWSLVLGLLVFLPVAATGFVDFLTLPDNSPAAQVATRHMMAGTCTATCFLLSLILRKFQESEGIPWLSLGASGLGLLLLAITGWHGGELVFKHGVGVENPRSKASN